VIRDPIKVFSSYYISLTFKFQYLYISLSIGSQTLDHCYHIGCDGSEITRIHDVWKRSWINDILNIFHQLRSLDSHELMA